MGVIDFIKKQTGKILVILGLSTTVATLSGCEPYEEKTTNKAIEIIEDATKHVDGQKYESLKNDIKACEKLIEHINKLSDDKQGEGSSIANETLKALDAVNTIVTSSKGLERSGESLIEQGQKWYAEVSSDSAWKDLRDVVNTVNEWPEDEFGEFASTIEGLYYETGETVGWDVEKLESFLNGKQQQTTQQQATQGQTTNENTQTQEDNSSSSNIIEDAANAIGGAVGGAVNKFKQGYDEATDGMSNFNQGLVEGLSPEDQAAYYGTEAERQEEIIKEAESKKAEAERKAAEVSGSLENTSFQMAETSDFRKSMKVKENTLKIDPDKPVVQQVLKQIDGLIEPDDEAQL